ncbi:MAG: type VI-A CRISPR-associated RNA-guided ribonuclease Cas13a, partial [Pseudomonadota bacterium]
VRIWCQAIALGARSFKHWADPEDQYQQDILLCKDFCTTDHYTDMVSLLFGNHQDLFLKDRDVETKKEILAQTRFYLSQLRNAIFHFKGFDQFNQQLKSLNKNPDTKNKNEILTIISKKIWRADQKAKSKKICDILEAAHAFTYFNQALSQKLYRLICQTPTHQIPLPKFAHILKTHENHKLKKNLPPLYNRQKLEAYPALTCQNQSLRWLYKNAFGNWLKKCDAQKIKGYIDDSVERPEKAAKSIYGNKKDKVQHDEGIIFSKVKKIIPQGGINNLSCLFAELTAQTATEMRVQNFYESDQQQAKKQAEYIEKLKREIITRAFCDFINHHKLQYILRLSEYSKPAKKWYQSDQRQTWIKEWTKDRSALVQLPVSSYEILYYLLHFIPVDYVNLLSHQIDKWRVLSNKDEDKNSQAIN